MGRKANSRTGRPQAQKLRGTHKFHDPSYVQQVKQAERAVRTIRKIEANSFYGDRNNTTAPEA